MHKIEMTIVYPLLLLLPLTGLLFLLYVLEVLPEKENIMKAERRLLSTIAEEDLEEIRFYCFPHWKKQTLLRGRIALCIVLSLLYSFVNPVLSVFLFYPVYRAEYRLMKLYLRLQTKKRDAQFVRIIRDILNYSQFMPIREAIRLSADRNRFFRKDLSELSEKLKRSRNPGKLFEEYIHRYRLLPSVAIHMKKLSEFYITEDQEGLLNYLKEEECEKRSCHYL